MRRAAHKPVLLTWDDIASEAEHLPVDEKALLREIAAARQVPLSGQQIIGDGWRLSELTVQGHIGIGDSPLSIYLPPGNGVTIISARNGVGKTSVADAARHLLSGGQERSYELEADNIHSDSTLLAVTMTNGPRDVRLSCWRDRRVRWHESGVEDDMPAQWIAAFERFRPVLLYPEISPVIDEPGELHKFLKGAIELTALDDLRRDLDVLRERGRTASKLVEDAYETTVERVRDLADNVLLSTLAMLGPKPSVASFDDFRAAVTELVDDEPEHPGLPAVWQVDRASVDRVTAAIEQVRASTDDALGGAKAVQVALDSLLGGTGHYVSDLRDRDVCPTCQTQGASWAAVAAAEAERLRSVLVGQTAAEQRLEEELEQLRQCLPPPLPHPTRTAVIALAGPGEADWMARWDELARERAGLTVDSVPATNVETLLASSADLALWFATARPRIVDNWNNRTIGRAVARERIREWLELLDRERDALDQQVVAERLVKKVEAWIKYARSEIFEPIGKRITEIWSALNVDADLDVTAIALSGGVRRAQKVTMDLAASGVPLPARVKKPAAVLSTGQRNALSLATYLPRATQPDSPFRFLVLDDPVHAFDEWRVRYLAVQLAALGEHHQIVVFTHDGRLWRELRALGVNPTHLRLDRPPGGGSRVRVKDVTRPSRQLLDEAQRALSQEADSPLGTHQARTAMVLALCRQAIDTEVSMLFEILGRRLSLTDQQIRTDLDGAHNTRDQLALLNRYLTRAGLRPIPVGPYESLISTLNAGAHGRASPVNLERCRDWVRQTRKLTNQIHTAVG